MKRNPKPFSVEIKKSRVPGHHHQLPPRRLFEMVPVETTKAVLKEEPQVEAEPMAAPRILPSILQPAWGHEAAEPVHRRTSKGSAAKPGQLELDLTTASSDAAEDAPAGTLGSSEAGSQVGVAPVRDEDAMPGFEVQPSEAASVMTKARKPRNKAPDPGQQTSGSNAESEPEVIEPSPVVMPRKKDYRRLTKRQAATVHLARHERWKRRIHPAAW